jgi:uncharacterized membrane protein
VRASADSLGQLERQLGRLLVGGVIVSAALLGAGLAYWLLSPNAVLAARLLNAGLLALMATPMLRVLVSFVEYVRMRDWLFAAMTVVVLAELTITVLVALSRRS